MYAIKGAWRLSVFLTALWVSVAAAQDRKVAPPADAAARANAEKLAKTTLARARSIAVASIEVDSAQAIQWQDTSLGCPAPGMMYAQRLVSGYKVVLRAAGTSYDVHVGEGNAVICDPAGSAAGQKDAQAPPDVQAYRLAREALDSRAAAYLPTASC